MGCKSAERVVTREPWLHSPGVIIIMEILLNRLKKVLLLLKTLPIGQGQTMTKISYVCFLVGPYWTCGAEYLVLYLTLKRDDVFRVPANFAGW